MELLSLPSRLRGHEGTLDRQPRFALQQFADRNVPSEVSGQFEGALWHSHGLLLECHASHLYIGILIAGGLAVVQTSCRLVIAPHGQTKGKTVCTGWMHEYLTGRPSLPTAGAHPSHADGVKLT